jgi:hypothetical protein
MLIVTRETLTQEQQDILDAVNNLIGCSKDVSAHGFYQYCEAEKTLANLILNLSN